MDHSPVLEQEGWRWDSSLGCCLIWVKTWVLIALESWIYELRWWLQRKLPKGLFVKKKNLFIYSALLFSTVPGSRRDLRPLTKDQTPALEPWSLNHKTKIEGLIRNKTLMLQCGWTSRTLSTAKEVRHKGHILYDSIYMKPPEQVNPWRKKVDWLEVAGVGVWWLWEWLRGGGNGMGSGTRSGFRGEENILELDRVDSCTALWMY